MMWDYERYQSALQAATQARGEVERLTKKVNQLESDLTKAHTPEGKIIEQRRLEWRVEEARANLAMSKKSERNCKLGISAGTLMAGLIWLSPLPTVGQVILAVIGVAFVITGMIALFEETAPDVTADTLKLRKAEHDLNTFYVM